MSWMGPAIMGASALAGGLLSGSSSGDKAGGTPMYTMANMPGWLQDKFTGAMQGMPGSMNVNFGGQAYPTVYGPLARAGEMLYQPRGVMPYQTTSSGGAAGFASMMPYMAMALMGGGSNPWQTPTTGPGTTADLYGTWNSLYGPSAENSFQSAYNASMGSNPFGIPQMFS